MAFVNKRSLTIRIGTTEYNAQANKAVITSNPTESDFVSFADANAGGGKDYALELSLAQDMAVGTLWRSIWDSSGTTVACILRPYGNAVATAAQPHLTFSAVISEPEGDFLGGEADSSVTAVQLVEVTWKLTAKPILVIV
jgi:hypothetical protein